MKIEAQFLIKIYIHYVNFFSFRVKIQSFKSLITKNLKIF